MRQAVKQQGSRFTKLSKRLATAGLVLSAMVLAPAGVALGQAAFPSKPITLIVPYAPGGSTDVLGRMFAGRMGELLKQPMLVENRGGAGGLIGFRAAAQAPADGHTLVYTTSIIATNHLMYRNPGYKMDDFTVIGPGGILPYVLIANEGVPFRSVGELVAHAKANPNKLNYAALGKGSPTQLFMVRFMAAAGFQATEVLYNGAGPANKDTMAGNVQLQFTGATQANLTLARTVPLAITHEERLGMAPNVATFREGGYPNMLGGTWFAFFTPVKTPAPAVTRLRSALASASTDLKDKLSGFGIFPYLGKMEDFPAYIKADTARWEVDIKSLKLELID
jgi:tripartite-type tricarboxylate transporter receptor subunit TctC